MGRPDVVTRTIVDESAVEAGLDALDTPARRPERSKLRGFLRRAVPPIVVLIALVGI